jgi:hypothetical protein
MVAAVYVRVGARVLVREHGRDVHCAVVEIDIDRRGGAVPGPPGDRGAIGAVEIALGSLAEQQPAACGEVEVEEAKPPFIHWITTPKVWSEKSLRKGFMADSMPALLTTPFSNARMLWSARIGARVALCTATNSTISRLPSSVSSTAKAMIPVPGGPVSPPSGRTSL